LLEEAVHQRGLAVVDVRDDGNISNVLHVKLCEKPINQLG
jgi:hypothetical protein